MTKTTIGIIFIFIGILGLLFFKKITERSYKNYVYEKDDPDIYDPETVAFKRLILFVTFILVGIILLIKNC